MERKRVVQCTIHQKIKIKHEPSQSGKFERQIKAQAEQYLQASKLAHFLPSEKGEKPALLGLFLHHDSLHTVLLNKPPGCLLESQPCQCGRPVQNQRVPSVGASDDLRILRNHPQQCQSQHLLHIQHRHHVFPFDHVRPNPVHHHLNIPYSVTLQQPNDPVSVSQARDVRRGHQNGLIGRRNGCDESGIDSCRAIDENEVRAALLPGFQGVDDPDQGLAAEPHRQFGPGLRDTEQFEVGPALVPDEGLVEAAVAVEDLDDGVVDSVLEAEEEVEVAEADVGVYGDDGEAEAGEGEADIGGGGGLADAAFSGGDDDDAGGVAGQLGLPVVLEDGADCEGGRKIGF